MSGGSQLPNTIRKFSGRLCVWESQRNTTNTEGCFKERKTGCSRSESALMAVANTSKTVLNSSGESGHPCLVPDFRGNAFNFSPLRVMFAVGLSYIYVEVCSFYACLQETFYHKWMVNFVKAFSASIKIIIWFLSFNLLMWCITLIDLQILKNPCIPWIKPTWS